MQSNFFIVKGIAIAISLTACSVSSDKVIEPLIVLGAQPQQNKNADIALVELKEEWSSLSKVNHKPDWFQDAKLGIYTHWGPTSTANIGMKWASGWYGLDLYMDEVYDWKTGDVKLFGDKKQPKASYTYQHHVKAHGDPADFGYKDIIKQFNPDKFNAQEWADLFKLSGAKFAGPVAVHHDNFAMWDSDVTRWNSKAFTGKDITGELKSAIEQRGLKFLTSFHHAFTWVYYANAYKFDATPETADLYTDQHELTDFEPNDRFHEQWFAMLKEVIDKYQPDVIWFDWWVEVLNEEYRKKFVAYYYNKGKEWGKDVVINYKNTSFPDGIGVLDYERGRPNKLKDEFWMTDTSPGAWFYYENAKFVEPNQIVDILIDIVSKNGLMLLNVPPNPDGSIPAEMKDMLAKLGEWLAINGEGIYETRPWTVFGEGPTRINRGGHKIEKQKIAYTDKDIRFTKKGDNTIFAFVMAAPMQDIVIQTLNTHLSVLEGKIKSIEMLGSNEKVNWQLNENGLVIRKPNVLPSDFALGYKISLYQEQEVGIGGEDPGTNGE
ncbi:alpha-L-fucosidase [Algibacillus agarilyticus]|uniref:alpha-L-fucosidase n=1 Tax=Algibacillus agarilyticus TaxID=2234133 RepID=UPI000DCFF57F|nr:alpha-L-fucosidase [Algibacillus agarilyticus]